ncbi:hypothetical protein PFISCL1PPCAC_18291, partial [Pristionchus fissidentatus]
DAEASRPLSIGRRRMQAIAICCRTRSGFNSCCSCKSAAAARCWMPIAAATAAADVLQQQQTWLDEKVISADSERRKKKKGEENRLLDIFLEFVEYQVVNHGEGTHEDLRLLRKCLHEWPANDGSLIVVDMANAPRKKLHEMLPSVHTLVGVCGEIIKEKTKKKKRPIWRRLERLAVARQCTYGGMDDRLGMAMAISRNAYLLTNDHIEDHMEKFTAFLKFRGYDPIWGHKLARFLREKTIRCVNGRRLLWPQSSRSQIE